MANVIRGTTPTIRYSFHTVEVADITAAFLTIMQDGDKLIEKDLSAATVGEDYLAWTFSQAETLQMAIGKIAVQLNWKTSDGTRGASEKSTLGVNPNYKDEVI